MNSVAAFFLGILFVIIILVIFWFIANINPTINTTYKNSVCYGICAYTGIAGLGGPTPTS